MRAPITADVPEWIVTGTRAMLPDGRLEDVCVRIAGSYIVDVTSDEGRPSERRLDGGGRWLLPGIVDLHGDAFEHLLMPRPSVYFGTGMALAEADRQICANGITTAFHGITYSWEPGLRSGDTVRDIINTMERLRPTLGADTRLHLRYETRNIDAVDEIERWIRQKRFSLLSLHHRASTSPGRVDGSDEGVGQRVRSGLSDQEYSALAQRVMARSDDQIEAAIQRVCDVARSQNLAIASHEDDAPEWRRHFRGKGATLCEFPCNKPTAKEAHAAGDMIVLGAPNVLRGHSHLARLDACSSVASGLCDALASDYYYPSLAAAPFRLADGGICELADAWSLVSSGPAAAAGLYDRGYIEPGRRADMLLMDFDPDGNPAIAATIAGGRLVHAAAPDLCAAKPQAA